MGGVVPAVSRGAKHTLSKPNKASKSGYVRAAHTLHG